MNVSDRVRNRAFIFDMDGVLIDSEPYWSEFEEKFYLQTFGPEITKRLGHSPGRGVTEVYRLARDYGASVNKEEYLRGFDEVAMRVYDKAPLTKGIDELARAIIAHGFRIGIVTQSCNSWVARVIPRLKFRNKVSVIVSIDSSPKLKAKPAPDGYLKMFRQLKADPARSFVLEDSNPGIQSGKASGAFTIGYRGNLLPGYEQDGADAYAFTMNDVIALIERATLQ
jgi:HAD superfamily hydrolase (TIGR01509 family)